MKKSRKPSRFVPVSEVTLQRTAARLLPNSRLVTPEIVYLQRVLGATATQADIDEQVIAVRKLPWASIGTE